MLKSVAPQGNGACVVLKDPTGVSCKSVTNTSIVVICLHCENASKVCVLLESSSIVVYVEIFFFMALTR